MMSDDSSHYMNDAINRGFATQKSLVHPENCTENPGKFQAKKNVMYKKIPNVRKIPKIPKNSKKVSKIPKKFPKCT